MRDPDVIVIGGGQAGLAMSRSLTRRGIDHLVFERGRTGERWHSERWHSLHLLTINAQSALPGMPYTGDDPEGYMSAPAFAAYLSSYAQKVQAPILCGVEVANVERTAGRYRVSTNAGEWRSRAVVVATGACDVPFRPPMADALAPSIAQITPADYREPAQLPEGGVLVVGASATGAQLAEEIHTSGRPVVLSVGSHTRAPRRYRGGDIYVRMEEAGLLDDRADEGGNLESARRQRAPQLVGRPDNRDLDLGILSRMGIRLAGRLAAIDGTTVTFNGDLEQTTTASHQRMERILDRIDASIAGACRRLPEADPTVRMPFIAARDSHSLDLWREGIRSIVWATGYVRRYPWLALPVLDGRGEIVHRGGVTASTGLYTLGLTFQRRRRSSFINGCGIDAEEMAPVIKAQLDRTVRQVA